LLCQTSFELPTAVAVAYYSGWLGGTRLAIREPWANEHDPLLTTSISGRVLFHSPPSRHVLPTVWGRCCRNIICGCCRRQGEQRAAPHPTHHTRHCSNLIKQTKSI
jgi:hypothetical protein